MPRGKHLKGRPSNNPPQGMQKKVKLPEETWNFLKVVGGGNFSEGAREIIKMTMIVSFNNLSVAAEVLGLQDSSYEAIAKRIKELVPSIEDGRKDLSDLMSELILGECSLVMDGGLKRLVRVVQIKVRHPTNIRCVLREEKQVAHNGVEKVRRDSLGELFLPSEKLINLETPSQGVVRLGREELGVDIQNIKLIEEDLVNNNSESGYSGLKSEYKIFIYSADIPKKQIKNEYFEYQQTKTVHFAWI